MAYPTNSLQNLIRKIMSSLAYSEDILIEISDHLSYPSLLAWSQVSRAYNETLTRVILYQLGPCQYRPMKEWTQEVSYTVYSRGRPNKMRLRGGGLHYTRRFSRGSVLVWAASRGHIRLVRDILSMERMGSWINMPVLRRGHGTSPGSFGMTPLHAAAKRGHADIVHLLIEYGADVEATVAVNLRPIHFTNNERVVMALVRHGSSVHPQGKNTVSPLTHVLTTKPHLSAIQCLLQLGCNPNHATWLGFTAADAAVQTGNVEALQLLLDAGLDVSPSMLGNNSLIYKAIYCCQNDPPGVALRLIGLLLGHEISGKGKPPEYNQRQPAPTTSTHDPKDPRDSWTPFLRVFQKRPSLFVALLLNAKDAPIGYEVQDTDRYLSMVSSLIEHGASLDVHRESSMLLKFFLSHEDDFPQVIERIYMFLLDRLAGVPISHGQDPVTRQPIHFLFTRGYNFFDTETNAMISLSLLGHLLHLGADPNEPDSEGNTPLALLCQLPLHTHENQKLYISEATKLLVYYGAITSSKRKRTLRSTE